MKCVKKDVENDRICLTVQVNSLRVASMEKAIVLKNYRFPGTPDEHTFFDAKAAAALCHEGFGEFVVKAVIARTRQVTRYSKTSFGQDFSLQPVEVEITSGGSK